MTIPEAKIRDLPKDLFQGVPGDVVVVDTGNYYPRERDGRIGEIEAGMPESRWVEAQLGRPVVKAFNTMNYKHLLELGRPAGTPGRLALPVAGDDPRAKQIVLRLVEELGIWTESTMVDLTIPGVSSRARRFMTRNWTAPVSSMHWPKRERGACLSGGRRGTLQPGWPNMRDAAIMVHAAMSSLDRAAGEEMHEIIYCRRHGRDWTSVGLRAGGGERSARLPQGGTPG